MNHFTADGGYLLDDRVPQPIAYRVRLLGFNEARAFGIPFTNGVSDAPVSALELEKIRATGMAHELIPVFCEECAKLAEANEALQSRVVALMAEVAQLKKNKR